MGQRIWQRMQVTPNRIVGRYQNTGVFYADGRRVQDGHLRWPGLSVLTKPRTLPGDKRSVGSDLDRLRGPGLREYTQPRPPNPDGESTFGISTLVGTVVGGAAVGFCLLAPLAARSRHCPQALTASEDQRLSVAAPVRRLHLPFAGEDHVSHARVVVDGDGLKSTVERHRGRGLRRDERLQLDMRECRLLDSAVLMRADAQAGVEGFSKVQLDGSARLVQRLALHADEERDGVAVLLKANRLWSAEVEGDVLRRVAFVASILERGLAFFT